MWSIGEFWTSLEVNCQRFVIDGVQISSSVPRFGIADFSGALDSRVLQWKPVAMDSRLLDLLNLAVISEATERRAIGNELFIRKITTIEVLPVFGFIFAPVPFQQIGQKRLCLFCLRPRLFIFRKKSNQLLFNGM